MTACTSGRSEGSRAKRRLHGEMSSRKRATAQMGGLQLGGTQVCMLLGSFPRLAHTAPTLAVANCRWPSLSFSAEYSASRRAVSGSRSSVRPLRERQSNANTHTATCKLGSGGRMAIEAAGSSSGGGSM